VIELKRIDPKASAELAALVDALFQPAIAE